MSANGVRMILRRFSVVSLLTEIIHGLIIFSVLLIPVRAFAPDDTAMFLIWMASVYFLLWIARYLCSHIWHYVFLGLLMTAAPLLPALQLSMVSILLLIPTFLFMAIRTFVLRLNENKEQTTGLMSSQVLALFFLLALNLAVVRLDLYEVSQAYFYIAIVYLLVVLFRWHTISLDTQMARFDMMPSQPARRIRHFSQMLLVVFSSLILVILLISPFLHLHDLLPWFGTIALAVLRWLLHLLRSDSEPVPSEPQPEPTRPPQDEPLPMDPGETAIWWIIIQEIMYYLFLIASILAFLALIVYILYRIYRRFYDVQSGPDVAESILPRWSEDIKERVRRSGKRWRDRFGQSPEQKIRRLYHKSVIRLVQRWIKSRSDWSPRKFAGWLLKEQEIDILAMTYIYEKARYGPGECTDIEVRKMQELYRDFRGIRISYKRKEKSD